MQWTHEQSPIIQSKASKILVRAFAGTGKTTTLVGFAKANPTLRILYLCYNSSVEKAAKGKFPRNVMCKTVHNLAHAIYSTQYTHKMTMNWKMKRNRGVTSHASQQDCLCYEHSLPAKTSLRPSSDRTLACTKQKAALNQLSEPPHVF